MHIITISASPKQLSKLRNGHRVRIKKGKGFNLIVHPENYRLVSRAFGRNKGIEVQLSPEEIEANRSLPPEAHAKLRETQPEIAGEGIFGPKFDRMLKKAGVKTLAYQIGDQLKPMVKAGITGGLTAGATALGGIQPELIPFLPAGVAGLSGLAYDYIDNPDKYHDFISGVKQHGAKTIAKKYAKAKANEALNRQLGTNYDYMNRAGLENAARSELASELARRSVEARRRQSPQDEMEGQGFHRGYRPRGVFRGIEGGTIGKNGGHVVTIPPALVSQPLSANFQMAHFLPVQFQKYNNGPGMVIGSGLGVGLGAGLYI
jgi:hypothetical protein